MEKLLAANKMVKDCIRRNYNENTWEYEDFVKGDRFLEEIKGDEDIDIEVNSAEDLAHYAISKINEFSHLTSSVKIL